jgi:hypothetical protein
MRVTEFMRHFGGARLLVLLLGIIAPVPSFASHWVEVPGPGDSGAKVLVDTDSLQKLDQFTLVDIKTVYAAPRANSHNITLDSFVQRTAIDCARHTFVGVMTIGYLEGTRVGSSPETVDWRSKAVPMPNDAMSNRIYRMVCGSGRAGR